ncbi:hypothetical protein FEK30_00100 (plasmid) [Picosynechococcus sp. PCC 11901]|uniref:hypothetical protein n=1 Tax=Picosynechococcus sp. PCC 11901 TaxID=2579791 RepID=UPI0010FBFC91|nr:hypothetical protein [Picosynechococcus sp. PCC 11901]QCS47973.1 hypothetical protein FEK30_00100 [Picosynechococcus sp. PCC 11901]
MDKFVVSPQYRFTLDDSWAPNPLLAETLARRDFGCSFDDVAMENKPGVIMSAAFHHFGDRVPVDTPYSVTIADCDTTFNLLKKPDGEILVEYDSLAETFGEPPAEVAQTLTPGATYFHPKAETSVIEGQEVINMAGFYSMLIDAIINPDRTDDGGKKAEAVLSSLLVQKLPGRSAIAIIQQVKSTRNIWALNRVVDDLLAAE